MRTKTPNPIPDNMFELAAEEAREIRTQGSSGHHVHEVWVPESVDVGAIRAKLALTQVDFARQFGFGLRAVQQWEQGVRKPEGPARVLLAMMAVDPGAVRALLAKAGLSA